MNKKVLYGVLAAEAALLCALSWAAESLTGWFSTALAFPFEQLGAGLAALSRLGAWGNGAAVALWLGLSVAPLAAFSGVWKERRARAEAVALVALAAVLAAGLYLLANPALLLRRFPAADERLLPMAKALIGGAIWSVAALFAVLRLLRLFLAGNRERLLGYARLLLEGLCLLFVAAVCLPLFQELLAQLRAAQAGADGLLAILRFAVAALPYGLDLAIALAGLDLLEALTQGGGEQAVSAGKRLSRLCCAALAAAMVACAGLNLLQLALAPWLSDIDLTVRLPLPSLAFALAALLLSRLLEENKRLQEDNELFI